MMAVRTWPSILAAVAFVPVHAAGPAGAQRAAVEALYAEMHAAMDAKDAARVAVLMAPDFVSEDVDGTVDPAGAQDDFLKLPDDPNRFARTVVEEVTFAGATAHVRQRYEMTTLQRVDGVLQLVQFRAISTDTLQLIDGRWRMVRTVTQQVDFRVRGRLVDHQVHAPVPLSP